MWGFEMKGDEILTKGWNIRNVWFRNDFENIPIDN